MSSSSEMLEDERFDGLLLNFAQQCHGIDPLLDNMFSFLRRKTDFYSGDEKARASVLRMFEKHEALAQRTANEKKKRRAEEEERAKTRREAARKKSVEAPPPTTTTVAAKAASDDKKEGDEDDEPAPVGNGSKTSWGVWTQQLTELQIQVPIPEETKSRDLIVDIQKKSILVALKKDKENPLLKGELHKKVIVDDCFWTLEEDAAGRKEVVISFQKENKQEWWKCVVVGDPEINTQKVQPENSKLSDLDGETRMTVEKMMFDQRQKALGKPTADEMGKQEVLEKFMKQHPEMDFSKAKFN